MPWEWISLARMPGFQDWYKIHTFLPQNQAYTVMPVKKQKNPEVISFLTLRKTLGILGILLPIILVIGTIVLGGYERIQPSISEYYYTNMRNVLVGFLFTFGLFLYAYKGYGWQDNWAGHLGCIFALGVALCPCQSDHQIFRILHLASAVLLFSVFAYFSIILFTKSKHMKPYPPQKSRRNKWDVSCGITIIMSILLLFIYFIFLKGKFPGLDKLKPIFSLETLALWAFGLSWIIKGEVLLKDKLTNEIK